MIMTKNVMILNNVIIIENVKRAFSEQIYFIGRLESQKKKTKKKKNTAR